MPPWVKEPSGQDREGKPVGWQCGETKGAANGAREGQGPQGETTGGEPACPRQVVKQKSPIGQKREKVSLHECGVLYSVVRWGYKFCIMFCV